jgi:DUF971 family protein
MSDPVAIEADRGAGTLTIAWDDGHQSVYTVDQLRWACPCATCSGEWGRPGVLAALTSLPPEELRLADVRAVGMYAIAPVWASGHDSGIYSFDYLRSLCSCNECRAAHGTPGS